VSNAPLTFQWDDEHCYANGLRINGVRIRFAQQTLDRRTVEQMIEAAYTQGWNDRVPSTVSGELPCE
jgi:hypothetical protein